MDLQRITTYKQLHDVIEKLRVSYDGEIVFRGQTDYHNGEILPSILRAGSSSYMAEEHRDWRRFVWWMLMHLMVDYQKYRKRIAPDADQRVDAEPEYPLNVHFDAILQHYGARSSFVDVTRSLEVALWFAHHRFQAKTLVVDGKHVSSGKVEPAYDISIMATSYENREAQETGYVFVFAARDSLHKGSLDHGDFIDLTKGVMSQRMLAQQAGLLYASSESNGGRLEPLACFEFSVPLNGMPRRLLTAKTHEYFPGPETDTTYHLILKSSPFVENYGGDRVIRRSLPIPEYIDRLHKPPKSQWRAFRRDDVALLPTHILNVCREVDKQTIMPFRCEIEGRQYALADAVGILSRVASSELSARWVDLAAPIDIPETFWSVFLEYPPFQTFMPFLKEQYWLVFVPENPDGTVNLSPIVFKELPGIRGVWIVKEKNEYWCQLFGFHQNEFTPYLGFYFHGNNPNALELLSPRPGNDEAEYLFKATLAALQHSLSVLRQTQVGSLKLSESTDPVFDYYLDNPSLHSY